MTSVVRVGVLKAGCIGALPLLEFLLDERAERNDIDIRVIGSGAKLGPEQCKEITELIAKQKLDLVIFVGPAQVAPGPTEARKILQTSGKPTIVISDSPAKKVAKEMEDAGLGYIILEADSMIGARREFLDPAEMAVYNSDVTRILALTGTLNLVVEEIDRVIKVLGTGKKPDLPRLIVDGKRAIESAGFSNPYAQAKALAAYEIAKQVSAITTEACFKTKDWKVYVSMVATAHEIMRTAAKLADEARELEKTQNSVLRKPHFDDGTLGAKKALIEKPKRIE